MRNQPNGETGTLRLVRDGARSAGGMTLRFDPPKDARSGGFALDMGRVRGIRFVRTGS
jgi:hypothetical protein